MSNKSYVALTAEIEQLQRAVQMLSWEKRDLRTRVKTLERDVKRLEEKHSEFEAELRVANNDLMACRMASKGAAEACIMPVVERREFRKGEDELAPGADHKTFGISEWNGGVEAHGNRIKVYGDEALRDYILSTLLAPTSIMVTKGDYQAARTYIANWCPDHVKKYIANLEQKVANFYGNYVSGKD